ncbi:centrosomal protein of 68 kDa isoform X2 [Parambassis ranga]|uniref:Centrosomal protein of 68 kDa isoform X2 n=1 Tax=Parambassis ranga TaxID=210632 RepID=A0A6P7JWU2_9TELE|nr:centrosomal protein of 68 kDa isoform X2 [Parambassis ranga]
MLLDEDSSCTEAKGCSQRKKTHLSDLNFITTEYERGRTTKAGKGEPHRSVTMAASSRYLTDRQYEMRRPLCSSEPYASILKKSRTQTFTEKEKRLGEHSSMSWSGEEPFPERLSPSQGDTTPPSASSRYLSLGVSSLEAPLCREEPTSERPFSASLSSSFLDGQKLNSTLRPQQTCPVLDPTCTPRSGYSRPDQTQLRLERREGSGGGETGLCFHRGHTKEGLKSPYQKNYWACAIPKTSPPSPDRHSADWDPNKDYQALLNYTYPLRPGHIVSELDSFKLQEKSCLQTYSNLQDSGIELDHLCSSSSLSGLGFSVSGTNPTRGRNTLSTGHRSPDLQGFNRSSEVPRCSTPHSPTDTMGLSLDSLNYRKDRGGASCSKTGSLRHQLPCSSAAFIRSACILPQSRCAEDDEEFLPLPEQLEELQLLSRQVRAITAKLSLPSRCSWESLEPGTTSSLSSSTLPEKQAADEEAEVKLYKDGADKGGRKPSSAPQTVVIEEGHRDSETRRSSFEAWVKSAERSLNWSNLREMEAFVESLRGLTLPDSQRKSPGDQELSDSLMEHVQVFCSHLELLIQQLYAVSEKMELLAAPTVDIDSVKSSLAKYQSFQREVSSHQPLTSCVLRTGQLLLSCINTTSPLLGETLLLIERQSGALQTYTEHFFSSILSAMDNLTQPSTAEKSL